MDGFRLLEQIRLTNILSYGQKSEPITLQPLNVLIGPNGSGKSNLIDAISLLRAAPSDLAAPIRAGGGASEWIWKGAGANGLPMAVDAFVTPLLPGVTVSPGRAFPRIGARLRYTLRLAVTGPNPAIDEEEISLGAGDDQAGVRSLYHNERGRATVLAHMPTRGGQLGPLESRPSEYTPPGGVSWTHSVLSLIRDFERYPEITALSDRLAQVALFRSIGIGRDSKLRGPQRADEPASFLVEDGRNLGVVLSDLLNQPSTKKQILKELRRVYNPVEDITTKVYANAVETSIHERGLTQPIPSVRLSDGILRYLSLLTVLCHPNPPPLICIEDPEAGLHPDILPRLAELLIEASQRMQLIVTTHSDILVSALGEVPEAVVVCERDDAGTHLRRLDKDSLDEWLKKYTLGGLWAMGELGGNP